MTIMRIKSGRVRHRSGCRPPEGYECDIPWRIKSPVVQKAIRDVLKEIGEYFFEDALRLEEKVGIILPFQKTTKVYGRWIPYPRSYYYFKKGLILLRDEEEMDIDIARVVFAHECGYAVDRGEFEQEWHESELPERYFKEACANYYVQRWGFGDLLEKALKRDLDIITPEGMREAHKLAEIAQSRFYSWEGDD